jgi:HlyD family secretion protein
MATSDKRVNGSARKPLKLIGAAVLLVAVVLVVLWLKVVRGGEDPTISMPTFVAKRGPLIISVLENGAIKAKEQEVIRNEVEGTTAIVSIVPEGTYVKKGDLLVELDLSKLTDTRIDQDIKVNNAHAALINAQETLKITESQGQSDVDKAELALRFAQQDLKQYQDGQYPNDEMAAGNKVQEANEVLIRAEETLKWSQTLRDEKYLSETELMADKLAALKGKNSLTVSQNDLKFLKDYTRQRKVDQLESDVKQAKMALDRAIAKANANNVQAKADLEAKEQEHKRQAAKLEKYDVQLSKSKLIAPTEGMVVYATSARGGFGREDRRPLADGVSVTERQELIYIPKSTSAVAEVDVHEASLKKVHAGLPAIVTVDALPDKKFIGTVARIAPLPNAQNMWMNPDLKVYTTNIELESDDPGLRSGMSCKAEIIVEQYQDVVYIPVQSVLRIDGQPTISVVNEDGDIEERKVEIGLDNDIMVMIASGVKEGEVVVMTPDLKRAAVEPGSQLPGSRDANDTVAQRINEKLKAANEAQLRSPAASAEGPGALRGGQPGSQAAGPGQAGPGGQGFQMPSPEQMQRLKNMTPEEREKAFQERLKSMTPEERDQAEKMRQRLQNMSPEEREKMRQQRRGSGGPGSGGRPDGTGPGSQGRGDGAGSGTDRPEKEQ